MKGKLQAIKRVCIWNFCFVENLMLSVIPRFHPCICEENTLIIWPLYINHVLILPLDQFHFSYILYKLCVLLLQHALINFLICCANNTTVQRI